jgi:hypothetical protein
MLRANRVSLAPFQVLVGPNAAGKTTLLDAVDFISDVVNLGARTAVDRRTPTFFDLCYDPDRPLQFAVEVDVPDDSPGASAHLRHELEIGIDPDDGLRILRENVFILPNGQAVPTLQPSLFGDAFSGPVHHTSWPKAWRRIAGKSAEGNDYFQDEKTRWNNQFRFGEDRSALGSIPEDPGRFPLSLRAKTFLKEGIRRLALEPRRLQASAPPGGKPALGLDGSNLPYVVRDLALRDGVLFAQWKTHMASAIRGLKDIDVAVREEDKHLVLSARFDGDHAQPVPSWLLSDGTLRLMALSVLSYAARPDQRVAYLVEEPENGLHPLAIQAAFDAISAPGTGVQWLCATHSPIFLSQVTLDDALVFRRQPDGSSMVRRGPEVLELADWAGKKNISDLFVMGVLT